MEIQIIPSKTYATSANAEKALTLKGYNDLPYLMMQRDGRFFPVFIGQKALNRAVHFDFCIVG